MARENTVGLMGTNKSIKYFLRMIFAYTGVLLLSYIKTRFFTDKLCRSGLVLYWNSTSGG